MFLSHALYKYMYSNASKYVEHNNRREKPLWRGMFTTKPAKSSWTCRQLCSDFLLMCACSDFALPHLWQLDNLNILDDFTFQIQYGRDSMIEKEAKWKCAFQIYYTTYHWVSGNASDVENHNLLLCQRDTFHSTDLTRRIDLPLTNDSKDGICAVISMKLIHLEGYCKTLIP